MQGFVRMGTAIRTARHVIQIIDTLDIERDVLSAFDETEIPARIRDLG
jgi:hypothetical protein